MKTSIEFVSPRLKSLAVLREHEKLFLIRLSNKISTRTKTKNMATIIFAGKSIAGNA